MVACCQYVYQFNIISIGFIGNSFNATQRTDEVAKQADSNKTGKLCRDTNIILKLEMEHSITFEFYPHLEITHFNFTTNYPSSKIK